MKRYKVDDCRNVLFQIFVVGYATMGESIVLLIRDKKTNHIIYSIVIDSFCYKKHNKTISLLRTNGLKDIKVNMLCWSHPDADHSLGLIDILKEYCSSQTKVLVPLGLNGLQSDCIDYNKKDKEIVAEIVRYNKGSKFTFNTISVTPQMYNHVEEFEIVDVSKQLAIQVDALSPISPIINETIQENRKIKKNDLSITLAVNINGIYKFVFASDAENESIKLMREESLQKPCFLKIPHHTSLTASEMIKFISNGSTIACSTIYKNHHLPNEVLLEDYCNKAAQVDITGLPSHTCDNYGMVEYKFDFFDNHEIHVRYHGNAHLIKQNNQILYKDNG